MHPKLEQYLSRYTTTSKHRFNKFFTQLAKESVATELPYLFDIENFCLRLFKAKQLNQKICIYSDYDTDAVTATSTMYWGLIELGFDTKNISTYAPDRFTEGYGMNPEAADKLSLEYNLIISVDCGINSVDEAKIVAAKGKADLIITDHHHLKGEVPDCTAVLNPRLGEYYHNNLDKLPKINLDNYSNIFTASQMEAAKTWFESIQKDLKNFSTTNPEYLSASVTGVGVSWFCLVWLAYFFDQLAD